MKGINARSLTMRASVLLGLGEIAQMFVIDTPAGAALMALLILPVDPTVYRDRSTPGLTAEAGEVVVEAEAEGFRLS